MAGSTRGRRRPVRNRNLVSALLIVALFILVFLIALGTDRSLSRGASGGAVGFELSWTAAYVGLLGLLAIGVAVIVFVLLSSAGRRRKGDIPERVHEFDIPWWGRVLGGLFALALLAVIAVAAILLRQDGEDFSPDPLGPPPSLLPVNGGRPAETVSIAPVQWALLGVLAAVALGGTVLVLLQRRRARMARRPAPRAPGRRQLRGAVEASLDDLEHEADARRAVIRAYVGMERVLAAHDLGRRPSEAPLEYLSRWSASLGISRPPGERLTELFQQARFSRHVVDAQMKREAIEALKALRDELAGAGA